MPITTHIHDPVIGQSTIRCRLCGELLSEAEEVIITVQSVVRARRIQDEIAAAGEYKASAITGDFVVYTKQESDLTTDILIRRVKDRDFEVIKRIRSEPME